ncbi:MAG: hypothetical protein WC071_06400 [Victivallaceae bacterium]
MIISRTPHRISLFGGGTDYPEYYLQYGGRVIGATIDKYCYLSVRKLPPFFSHKHRIVYSKSENVSSIEEIQHPAAREILKYLNIDYGVSIHHDGDIPARSGMGSSSAFTVGLLNSMYALEGKIISKEELARQAIIIEQQLIKENVGSQDQTFAAHGGFNRIEFCRNGEIVVNPIIVSPARLAELENSLMLFYTGISRYSSEIAEEQVKNMPVNIDTLHAMKEITDQAAAVVADESFSLNELGLLLNKTWQMKKLLSSRVSSQFIDQKYEAALHAGALGGKILGAGGGGFMLFFVPPEKRESVRKALNDLLQVPFKFDFNGSQIIVYQPNS